MTLFLVRSDGPDDLRWTGYGANSIGVSDLPRGTVIRIRPVRAHTGFADGPSKTSGSFLQPNPRVVVRTVEQIIQAIKSEYHSLSWHVFTTRAEAAAYCENGVGDFELLGIGPEATQAEIRTAFITRITLAHPDMPTGNHELAQQLNLAYERLKKRAA